MPLLDEQVTTIGDWLPGLAFWTIIIWLSLGIALSAGKRLYNYSRRRHLL